MKSSALALVKPPKLPATLLLLWTFSPASHLHIAAYIVPNIVKPDIVKLNENNDLKVQITMVVYLIICPKYN
jgi:hypothetical protein